MIHTLATIPWDSAYRPVLEGKFRLALREAPLFGPTYIRAQWFLEASDVSAMDGYVKMESTHGKVKV